MSISNENMKKLIKIDYIVLGSAPNYTGERERWIWGRGLYHYGKKYEIKADVNELRGNVSDGAKLLEIIKKAVRETESTVGGTCYDIIMHRAKPEDVRYSPKYQTIIVDDPYGNKMVVIDLSLEGE